MIRRPPRSTLFPTRRSSDLPRVERLHVGARVPLPGEQDHRSGAAAGDRKSTRLNSSHSQISYAVFCLKKKKKIEVNDLNKTSQYIDEAHEMHMNKLREDKLW